MNREDDARERLLAFGMTEDEVEIWFALAEVAGRTMNLPVLHPMEQQETASDFHRLQSRILARPGMRAQGWPAPGQ
jgi:hypothetical protein